MKRLISWVNTLLILLFVQITVTSCNDNIPNMPSVTDGYLDFEYTESDDEPILYNTLNGGSEVKYFDGCIYFFNGNSNGRQENHSTLYRLNTKTGNVTTVCPDPLCKHNTPDCPFYAMDSSYYIYKNKVYYTRTYFLDIDVKETGGYGDFVSFDLGDSKLKRYVAYDDSIHDTLFGSELFVDKYRFFYSAIVDTEAKKASPTINRMNLEDGSVDVLKEGNPFDIGSSHSIMGDKFLFTINKRVYFTDETKIYSTDYDMNNRQDILSGMVISSKILTDGEYIYWGESDDPDNVNLQTLYRAKLDGSGEKNPIGIKTANWQLTEKYIYYLNPKETIIGKNGLEQRPGDEIILSNNEIRRAAHDGSSNEAVFSLIQDDINFELYRYICVGNYVYTAYQTYTDSNNDGTIDDSEFYQSIYGEAYTVLRIDVTTGNTYYIHCGTEENMGGENEQQKN